jgi:hypothetical protein
MTGPDFPTFEDFVRTLSSGGEPPNDSVPLSKLPTGDYAVLAWLDDALSRLPAAVEAEITAHWDTISLRDVYAMLAAETDDPGARPS